MNGQRKAVPRCGTNSVIFCLQVYTFKKKPPDYGFAKKRGDAIVRARCVGFRKSRMYRDIFSVYEKCKQISKAACGMRC